MRNAQQYYVRTAPSPFRTAQKNKYATKCSDSVLIQADSRQIRGKEAKTTRNSRKKGISDRI